MDFKMTAKSDKKLVMSWKISMILVYTDLEDSPGGGHMVQLHQHPQSYFHCWGSYSAFCLQNKKLKQLFEHQTTDQCAASSKQTVGFVTQ